jgi:hypothetical protein
VLGAAQTLNKPEFRTHFSPARDPIPNKSPLAGNFNKLLNETTQPGSMFEPAYSKGGFEFFRYVEDGRMAYVGTVRDDTKKILGREPLLLREWAKAHANELLEIAGS